MRGSTAGTLALVWYVPPPSTAGTRELAAARLLPICTNRGLAPDRQSAAPVQIAPRAQILEPIPTLQSVEDHNVPEADDLLRHILDLMSGTWAVLQISCCHAEAAETLSHFSQRYENKINDKLI